MNPSNQDASNDWQGFYEQFQGESPRAAVILGAGFLDVRLRELIASFLIDDKNMVDDFLGSDDKADRPLSTFSSRIKAAYCLGLISREEHDDLNLIRRIRNRFAHRLHDLSFDNDEIRNWCHSLQIPKKMLPADWAKSHRDLFMVSVSMIATQIGLRALSQINGRRVVPEGFKVAEYIRVQDLNSSKE